jgi:hypothetical protein
MRGPHILRRSDDLAVYDHQHSGWMREHLHLRDIAAKLRRATLEEPLDDLPQEISLLVAKICEREYVHGRREEAGSSSPSPARPGAAGFPRSPADGEGEA